MVDRLRLSRAQIAKIVGGDPEAIRQFEKLLAMGDGMDASLSDIALTAGAADGKANEALATLQRIADALETRPVSVPVAPVDWLEPARQPDTPTSGWAVYNHGGGTQSIAASTRTQLSIDGATKIEFELPPNTGPLWDTSTNRITGRYGDAIVVKVQCIVTPTTAAASEVLFDIDVGGAIGVVEYQTFILGKGSGNPHYISWTFLAYTLDTWATNGGKLYVTTDGPCDVTSLRILISRTHKGV